MANRKITDLVALTAPATGDLLPIVDISEAAAADKNKKITYGELLSSAPAGTAAAPSFSFDGDPNTGIYNPGADQVAISTGGTGRLFVDASGKVTIPTTSVGLIVSQGATGTGTNGQIALGDIGPGTPNARIDGYRTGGSFAGELHFYTTVAGGTVTRAVTIDSSQRVGIGTSAPSQLLDVRNSSAATQTLVGIGDSNLARILVGYTPAGSPSSADSSAVFTDNAGDITLSTRSGVANFISFNTSTGTGAATERARIDSSGRLLVGTSTSRSNAFGPANIQIESDTPLSALHARADNAFGAAFVIGKTRGSSNQAVTNGDVLGIISFQGGNGSTMLNGADITAVVTGAVSGGGANDLPTSLIFSTTADGAGSPTERLRITAAGNVGIGTSSPQHLLQVTSGTNFGAVLKVSDSNSNSTGVIAFGDSTTTQTACGIWRGAANSYSSAGNALNVQGQTICFMSAGGIFGSVAEAARFDSSGRLLVGLTSANTSGAKLQTVDGLTFPATQVASADPNTLDDYEEGTWTPIISGLTGFDGPAGAYTKVGRMVYCSFFVGGTYLSAYTVANPVITGFPFSYSVNQLAAGSAAILRYDTMTLIAGPVAIAGNGEIRMILADSGTHSPTRGFGGQFSYRIT
jgi:hypothetical protein